MSYSLTNAGFSRNFEYRTVLLYTVLLHEEQGDHMKGKWYLVYQDFDLSRETPMEAIAHGLHRVPLDDAKTEDEALKMASAKWAEVLKENPPEYKYMDTYPSDPRVVYEITMTKRVVPH